MSRETQGPREDFTPLGPWVRDALAYWFKLKTKDLLLESSLHIRLA